MKNRWSLAALANNVGAWLILEGVWPTIMNNVVNVEEVWPNAVGNY